MLRTLNRLYNNENCLAHYYPNLDLLNILRLQKGEIIFINTWQTILYKILSCRMDSSEALTTIQQAMLVKGWHAEQMEDSKLVSLPAALSAAEMQGLSCIYIKLGKQNGREKAKRKIFFFQLLELKFSYSELLNLTRTDTSRYIIFSFI